MCINKVTTYPLPYDHDLKVLTTTPEPIIVFVYFLCTEQKSFDSSSTSLDRLLTHSEKKKLTMEEKGIYNTK